MNDYLQPSDVIDWRHPEIMALAARLRAESTDIPALARACFTFVRDEIHHSLDYRMNPVTWRASDVLRHRTGYCYAKSHLLAALLRANDIPAGFCYQRLSLDDKGAPYSLHGLNAMHLPSGWYRVDARGNRPGIDAQFRPPIEQLAFPINLPEEADFPGILAEPLPVVINALQSQSTWDALLQNLPDITLAAAHACGLTTRVSETTPSQSRSESE
ncbi:MAG: transglutaminase-like domain-containing protein [Blastocatellia bacterium]